MSEPKISEGVNRDYEGLQALNMVIHKVSDPSGIVVLEGQLAYDTVKKKLCCFNGSEVFYVVNENQIPRLLQWKICRDSETPVVGNGIVVFCIPYEMNGYKLQTAEAYLTTAGTGNTLVSLKNITTNNDMLTVPIKITGGELTSYDSSPRSVIDESHNTVSIKHQIAINVTNVAVGSKGLGLMLAFSKNYQSLS